MTGIETLRKHVQNQVQISDTEWDIFLKSVDIQEKVIPAGDSFVRVHDSQLKLAYIVKGIIKAYVDTHDGGVYIKRFVAEGRFVGPYYSLITMQPSTLNFMALEDTRLLVFDAYKVREFVTSHPKFEKFNRQLAELYFCEAEEKEINHVTLQATERYQKFAEINQDILHRIPIKDIAYYLGITPVSLSRIRKNIANLS